MVTILRQMPPPVKGPEVRMSERGPLYLNCDTEWGVPHFPARNSFGSSPVEPAEVGGGRALVARKGIARERIAHNLIPRQRIARESIPRGSIAHHSIVRETIARDRGGWLTCQVGGPIRSSNETPQFCISPPRKEHFIFGSRCAMMLASDGKWFPRKMWRRQC